MDEQQEYEHKSYRIYEGDIISVKRQDVDKNGNHYTFYKTELKNKKDDSQTYYKPLSFPKGTDIKDGTRIQIKSMVEYGRHLDRFNDVFYLYIEDYEILGDKVETLVDEYKEQLENNDRLF